MGAIATVTAPHTGRSPNDRFVVRDEESEEAVDWGSVNVPVSSAHFSALRSDVIEFLNERDLFVQDARAGEDPTHGIDVRVVSERRGIPCSLTTCSFGSTSRRVKPSNQISQCSTLRTLKLIRHAMVADLKPL